MSLKLGIIAGEGQLPASVARSALVKGYEIYVLRIEGLADEVGLCFFPGCAWNLGQIGGAMKILRDENCESVVFAGYVTRPDFTKIKFDKEGQALLPKIAAAAKEGDDAALGVFVSAFQDNGFKVLGAHDIYQDLLCPEGNMTKAGPDTGARADLEKAFHIAGVIVREGIGQGVLVKRAKPGQERRVDLPTIGVRTIEAAAAAGLAGIGLEAGASLIIDREATIRAADEAGVFLIGMALDEVE